MQTISLFLLYMYSVHYNKFLKLLLCTEKGLGIMYSVHVDVHVHTCICTCTCIMALRVCSACRLQGLRSLMG